MTNKRVEERSFETERLEAAGQWLLRVNEDSLTDAEMTEWIEWCEADPRNMRAFEEMQALWRGAAEHPPASDPRGVVNEPLAATSESWFCESAVSSNRSRTRTPLWTAIAACAALVIVGVAYLSSEWFGAQHIAAVEHVETPVAANREAVLPDGSRIAIGARSIVDVDFAGDTRRLEVHDGQAFFQVKRDPVRPFVVKAGELQIKAIGTAFDVRRAVDEIVVTVQEGVVEITREEYERAATSLTENGTSIANDRDARVRIAAGEQFVFNARSGATRQALVDPAAVLAWRAGRLEFTGNSLHSILENVNRYSHEPIVLDDPSLGELSFTGTVFVDAVDAWLEGLEQVFPIDVERDAEGKIILRRKPDALSG